MDWSEPSSRVLYVIVCAAPPTRDVAILVTAAQERRWDVCVIATPLALRFFDAQAIEKLTGHPVRSEYKLPGTPDVLPPPDAIVVAPATFNTINKWAAGISDTLALGLLTEAMGKRLPIVALPFTNAEHAAHPVFGENIARLQSWGVTVLYGPDGYPFHDREPDGERAGSFPWLTVLDALGS
ncbi:MAG: flavoprotein [Micromonosporaceae bacterium]